MTSLYDRLGGEGAIASVVDKFYDFILIDPKVNHFFSTTDMTKQRRLQKEFITLVFFNFIFQVTGGPNVYEGKDMKEAHKHIKISQQDYDAIWGHLEASLNAHKVGSELIDELKTIFYSVQDEIVNA